MNILAQPTLVLNKNWMPINTVSVKDAVTMVCGDWRDEKGRIQPKATVLDIDTWRTYTWGDWETLLPRECDGVIHRPNDKVVRAPEIIIVTRYSKLPRNQLNFNRRNLFRRDEDRCQYCGCKPGNSELSIDHILPSSKGGKSTWENCVACCVECNQKKADKTLDQCGMRLIRMPMKPGLEILGNTSQKIRSWEIFFGREVSRFATRDEIVSEAYWTVPLE